MSVNNLGASETANQHRPGRKADYDAPPIGTIEKFPGICVIIRDETIFSIFGVSNRMRVSNRNRTESAKPRYVNDTNLGLNSVCFNHFCTTK